MQRLQSISIAPAVGYGDGFGWDREGLKDHGERILAKSSAPGRLVVGVCIRHPITFPSLPPFHSHDRPQHLFIYLLCVFSQLLSTSVGFMLIVVISKNVLFENDFKFIESETKTKIV